MLHRIPPPTQIHLKNDHTLLATSSGARCPMCLGDIDTERALSWANDASSDSRARPTAKYWNEIGLQLSSMQLFFRLCFLFQGEGRNRIYLAQLRYQSYFVRNFIF